jgi:hypothetical protein
MSDPTAIELQVTQLIRDRADFFAKKNNKDLALPVFIEKMKKKYDYLHNSSKTLFDKVMAGEFDNPEAQARFKQMITLMKSIHEGKRSQKDADMIFGKVMADKYVTPIINNLPEQPPPANQ